MTQRPLQNRVLPTGSIVAIAGRGTFTGNRGIIHRADRTLGTSRWSHHAWICCTLDWQGRRRKIMTGRNWTELFFLDEAVALTAGHRPCGYCRRADYRRFTTAWKNATGTLPKAPEMDRVLHAARVSSRTRAQITYDADIATLPDGAFVIWKGQPHLVWGAKLLKYQPDGYGTVAEHETAQRVTVLTPKPMITVLQAGYTPDLHPSASIDVSAQTA